MRSAEAYLEGGLLCLVFGYAASVAGHRRDLGQPLPSPLSCGLFVQEIY
jgi:hypothetical protein